MNIWNRNWDEIELGSIAAITTGCLYPQYEWPMDDLHPIVAIDRLQAGTIALTDTRYIRLSEREHFKYQYKKGDLVFIHRSSPAQMGRSTLFDLNQDVLHTKYLRIRSVSGYNSRVLLHVLETYRMQGLFLRMARVKPNLACILLDDLKKIRVPFPSEEEQMKMITQLGSGLADTRLESVRYSRA
jgi:hypothetical protein